MCCARLMVCQCSEPGMKEAIVGLCLFLQGPFGEPGKQGRKGLQVWLPAWWLLALMHANMDHCFLFCSVPFRVLKVCLVHQGHPDCAE